MPVAQDAILRTNRVRGGGFMEKVAGWTTDDDRLFSGNMESVSTLKMLEQRRELVAQGQSRLLTEEESWEALRKAGLRV